MILSAEEIAELRSIQEGEQVDTCRVTRATDGQRVLNPITRKYVDGPAQTVYQGRCALGDPSGPAEALAGDAAWDVQTRVLRVPVVGSEAIAPGQTVEFVDSPHNPSLVGTTYGIVAAMDSSLPTTRRFLVKRVVS